MSEGPAPALVCGFSDLAAGLGGIAWQLGESGGLLLSNDEVEAADTVQISAEGENLRLEMKAGKTEVEATLVPGVKPAVVQTTDGSEAPGGPLEAAICAATVRSKGWGRTLQCPGHLSRWSADPTDGAGVFRHLTIEDSAGSLLLLTSHGGPGAEGHGQEDATAWRLDSEGGAIAFGEALLSTQYDEAGRQTRAGMELWPEGEEQANRAAATRAAGTRIGGTETADHGTSVALLRCSTEGAPGLGGYLIWRA